MNQPWYYSEVNYLICGICQQQVPINELESHNCRARKDFTKKEIDMLIDRTDFIAGSEASKGYRTPRYNACISLMYALKIYRDTFFEGGEK